MPIGSILGGMIAQGGQNTAAGMNAGSAMNTGNTVNNAINNNATNYSPYTAGGINSQALIGALEGYGNLVSPSPGAPYAYQSDPNAFGQAQSQVNALATASGAVQPTATNYQFSPETAVSSTFQADPSYAWRLSQGLGALNNSAAATGMGMSGAQSQALTNYGQNAASQEYGNWFGRRMNQDQYNTTGQLATNAQNFGQQQQQFANTQGNWNNALGMLTGQSQLGESATANQANVDASLTNSGNSTMAGSTAAAANNTANASQALSAGIMGGINSLASAYTYGAGGFGGGGYIPSPGSQGINVGSIGGMPASYYTGGGASPTQT